MNFLLPWWAKPLMALLVAGGLWWGWESFLARERAVGAAAVEAAYAQGFDVAAAAVRAEEARKLEATEKAHAEDIDRANARIAADLVTRTQLERLLASSAAPRRAAPAGQAASGPSADGTADAFRGLFRACASDFAAMASDRGHLADQVIGLQDFLLANEIGGDSPAGVRPRAGSASSLATQPATAPSWSTPTGAAPPQGSPA
jgi:hypothetical protein